ncbi:MAG: isoprenylcysteine carboxyl methyltransferase family protein [Reyranellaceae bacterium]
MIQFGLPQIVVLLVAAQRLIELALAHANTRRLMQQGGVEIGARHYPLFVLLHAGWLLALFLLVPADAPASIPLLSAFVILQLLRVWTVISLGRYWTTRIITVPGAPLVRSGPYRFLRHPNYAVVIGEIALLPLAFGAWEIAILFSVLNLTLLWHRVRVEDAALAARR